MEIPFCASNANFTWLNLNSDVFFSLKGFKSHLEWFISRLFDYHKFISLPVVVKFLAFQFFSFLQFLFHEFQIKFSCLNFYGFAFFVACLKGNFLGSQKNFFTRFPKFLSQTFWAKISTQFSFQSPVARRKILIRKFIVIYKTQWENQRTNKNTKVFPQSFFRTRNIFNSSWKEENSYFWLLKCVKIFWFG